MLGRTDSRRRMLLLLITFIVIAASLVARLAYWQVTQRDRLSGEAFAQTTKVSTTPSRRGDIFDRSGTVVLATTVDRERLAAMPSELTPQRRQEVAAELVRILRLSGDDADLLTARMLTTKQYVILAHGLDRTTADLVRAAAQAKDVEAVMLEPEPVRVYPHEGGGPEFDARRAAPRLRQPRRRRPVRRGAVLQHRPGRPSQGRARATRRGRPAHPGHRRRRGPGDARRGPPPHDRRRPPARPRAGGPRRVGRRQGPERVGARHGSVHRRSPRRDDLSVVRRQRLPADRGRRPQPVHRPDRQLRLRARLGLQDAHRDRGPRDPHGHDPDEDQGHGHPQAARAHPHRRRRPQGPRLDDVRGRRGLLAQRRRGEGRAGAGQEHPPVVGDPPLGLGEDGLRVEDRDRPRRRGGRHRPRPDDHPVAADRPRERGVRPGRRRSRRSSSRRRSRRWSTAARSSSPTS